MSQDSSMNNYYGMIYLSHTISTMLEVLEANIVFQLCQIIHHDTSNSGQDWERLFLFTNVSTIINF